MATAACNGYLAPNSSSFHCCFWWVDGFSGSTARPTIVAQASIAVLPFTALSSGADDSYFADGLTEEIINALSALPDLLVTARTSAFYFKGKDVPIPEIAAALGVAHIVEGSVRRSGDKVRITAQLIRASDGFHLWSQTYDHSLGDDFAVQTRIAESVASTLGVLLDERKRATMEDIGVRDVEAFVAYQWGAELFNRAHNEGPMLALLACANIEFEAAIARKPDFADALFQHADYYAHFLIDEAPGHGSQFVSGNGGRHRRRGPAASRGLRSRVSLRT
jgi:TolB-like protein